MSTPAAQAAPIRPVYLVTDEAEAAAATAPSMMELAIPWLVAAAVVTLAVATACMLVRRRRRLAAAMDPADAALRSLAWRLRLRREDRAALRALAAMRVPGWPGAVHPVALLVSRHAFEAAVAHAHRGDAGAALDGAKVERLRRRAFGAG